MNQRSFLFLSACLFVLFSSFCRAQGKAALAQETPRPSLAESEEVLTRLRTIMHEQAMLFFSPKTHAWYAQHLDKLPSASDVIDLYPNPVGYGTGMDDCPLFEGVLLVAIVELYDITRAECLRKEAFEAYQGLKLCGTAHGVRGFVARGVSIEDGKSVYITSSRDQYTHYVDGLWQYYRSPLCDEKTKGEIRELLGDLADAMKEQIVEENDFGFLRADGSKDPRGLQKMWHVYAHEVARLPMIYAAAWDVAGNKVHYELYRKYLIPAIEQSVDLKNKPKNELTAWVPAYSYLQMECSLALLYRVEKDPKVKVDILEAMTVAKRLASEKMASAAKRGARELAEVLIAQLMIKEFGLADEQKHYLSEALDAANLGRGGPPTTIHLLALYCKACQSGLFPVPKEVCPETWTPDRHGQDKMAGSVSKGKPLVKSDRDEHLVVFLSDLHAGVDGSNGEKAKENLDQLKAFCGRILAMKPRPAAVIIAGDLAPAQGTKQDYESLKPILRQFDAAGIPWRVCLGDTDRREAFFEVFPQFKAKASQVPERLVDVLELPRADFILIDTLQEETASDVLDGVQREWLKKEIDKHRQSGKRFFVVSHHPVTDLDVVSLLERSPSCVGCINGHEHLWRQDAKSALKRYSLQSTAYAPNTSTRCGFTYLKMDRWEFVFRPVSSNTDDLWERRIWAVRFPR
jgi:hypothetical protein